jgi:hypothetical protein
MEYLIVRFEGEDRAVVIDWRRQGRTDQVLEVERGTHEISLEGPPFNFEPLLQTVVLMNTTPLSPMEVTFAKK